MSADLSSSAGRGPYAVGVATLEIADQGEPGRSLPVDVWYPAREASATPADHPFGRPHAATAEAPAAPGNFPLVVFSHGNSGLRRQSTFLTTHLASMGIVIAAPDHTGNTFSEMAAIRSEDERKRVHFSSRTHRPSDLSAVIDRVLNGSGRWPSIDADRIAALGHSFGGWTALKMPRRDARVKAVCTLAPASEAFIGRTAFEPGELPLADLRPLLVIAGVNDVLVDLEASVRPLFARMGAPCALLGIQGADHFHFCDGIELLHGMHEARPRPAQTQPTLPYAQLLPEARTHNILNALVGGFFASVFAGLSDPCQALDVETLTAFDPAVLRLDSQVGQLERRVS